jgi:hypothetical protein
MLTVRLLARAANKRRLVDEVRQIRAGESRRAARDERGLHIIRQRHAAHMHAQNLLAAAHIRQRHDHLAVEPAGPQQRRIEHIGAIGGGDDNDALIALEAVHLDQQLVQRLLALVVTAAQTRAAVAPDGIDLVDEDDARRVLLRLLEHVAHARGADADEHFHEVGAGDRKEGHFRLAGDGARQQRLAGAGRADHEDALRDLAAELLELARVLQEVDDLGDFLLRLLDPGDVGEGHIHLILAQEARAALAEGHGPPPSGCALHLPQHVDEDHDEEQRRRELQQKLRHEIRLLRRTALDGDVRLRQRTDQGREVGLGIVSLELGLVLSDPIDHLALQDDRFDAARLNVVQEARVTHFLGLADRGHIAAEHRQQHQHDHHPQQDIFRQIVQGPNLARSTSTSTATCIRTYTITKAFASRYSSGLREREACGFMSLTVANCSRAVRTNSSKPAP